MIRLTVSRWIATAILAFSSADTFAARGEQLRLQQNLSRAVQHLKQRADLGDARRLLLIPFLARMYQRSADVRALGWHAGKLCEQLTQRGLQPFCRLTDLDAGTTPALLGAMRSDTDRLLGKALHCDRIDLPSLDEDLRSASLGSGYLLTHAGLALVLATQNGCLSRPIIKELWALLRPRLANEVRAAGAASDLGMEALVLLLVAGGAEVESAWLTTAIGAQNQDGGWGQKPGEASWDHTSVLGYWLLLALREGHGPTRAKLRVGAE